MVEHLAELVRGMRPQEGVGIVSAGKRHDSYGQLGSKAESGGLDRRLVSGPVVVVDERHLVGDLLEHLHVLIGEGRALSRDGIREAARLQADAVNLPFADNDFVVRRLGDGAGGLVESVENV